MSKQTKRETLTRGHDEKSRRVEDEKPLTREELRGAVARGWCSDLNRHKVMDPDLAEAIVSELMDLDADCRLNSATALVHL